MGRPKNTTPIQCEFFRWTPFQRDGVWYADGRGNTPNPGKRSLGTRDRDEAAENLKALDRHMAVKLGLAQPDVIRSPDGPTIADGWTLLFESKSVPQALGGWSPATRNRYGSVRKVVEEFCRGRGVERWNQLNRRLVDEYSNWRHDNGRAPRTIKTELDALRAANHWLVREGHLDASSRLDIRVPKMNFSDTYCYTSEQVKAMVVHARGTGQSWVADILATLAMAGLRIGELRQLNCSDVDLENDTIHVRDQRFGKGRSTRRTKGRESRHVPVCGDLKPVLAAASKGSGQLFRGPGGRDLTYWTVLNTLKDSIIAPLASRFPSPEGERGFTDGRLHSFRHYFVTQCFASGVPEAQIIDWIGQSGSHIVARYRHLRPSDGQRAIERVTFFGEPTKPDGPAAVDLHHHVEGGARDDEPADDNAAA